MRKESQLGLDLSGTGVQLLNRQRDLFLEPIFLAQDRCWDVSKSYCGLIHFLISFEWGVVKAELFFLGFSEFAKG